MGGQCFEWGVRVSLSRYSGVGGGTVVWMGSAGLAELLEWGGNAWVGVGLS